MELEDLDSISKNDFLPLLQFNIKQELLDHNVVGTATGTGGGVDSDVDMGAVMVTANSSSGSNSGGGGGGNMNNGNSLGTASGPGESAGAGESIGNLCDSVQKQVDEHSGAAGEPCLTKCIWCDQQLAAADAPKLLECLHVACGQCVTARFSEIDRTLPSLVHCPRCSMASQPDQIIDNQFLIEQNHTVGADAADAAAGAGSDVGDGKPAIKCSSCTDDVSATSWCVECSEFICDSCVQAHQRLKITKDHTIKTKEEAASDQQCGPNASGAADRSLMCDTHPAEKLSLFCETCDKLTCRDCQLSADHRHHKYKFAHEIADETRTQLGSLLNEITYKRVLLNSAMKVIDDRQTLIADKKKELVKEITQMVVKITNTVNMRGKQLVLRLNEVCDSKLKVLNEKKDALQLLSGHTDHCIDFVQAALDKGSDNAVLFSKKTLSRHLLKVKCQRADIPNPEIPVRIQVQLNQVQELQKVISQVGTIIVDGKAYPPSPSPGLPGTAGAGAAHQQQLRQQPSPNMIAGGGGGGAVMPGMRGPNGGRVTPVVGLGGAVGGIGAAQLLQQQQQGGSQQQQGPPHGGSSMQQLQQMSAAAQQQVPPPHYGSSPQYSSASPQLQQQQQQFTMQQQQQQMNRPQFGPDQQQQNAFGGRFPNMGPHLRGQVAAHVSSSTHPQNIGGGGGAGSMAGVFGNGPPFGLAGPSAATLVAAQQQQQQQQQQQHQLQQQQLQQQMQQQQQSAMGAGGMRSFGGAGPTSGPGVYGGIGAGANGPAGGSSQMGNGGGFMPNGPRYQNFQHRMQQGGGGGNGGAGAGGVPGQPMNMRPMIPNNEMRFANQQAQVFGQGHPSNHPPLQGAGGGMHGQHPHQQQQHQQQQQQHAVAQAAAIIQQQQQQQQHAAPAVAKWHIPQMVNR